MRGLTRTGNVNRLFFSIWIIANLNLPLQSSHRRSLSRRDRQVQELRELNAQTADVHLVVPNPDTLLASVPETDMDSAVLDVRDVFSRIPVGEQAPRLCL